MGNVTTYLSIISLIQYLLPILILLIILFFIMRTIKRYEKRANAKLEMDKINQKQLDDIHKKVNTIEKMLKEIE